MFPLLLLFFPEVQCTSFPGNFEIISIDFMNSIVLGIRRHESFHVE